MKSYTSVSGGQTSAFLAANYPTDENVFALVRVEDPRLRFPDEQIRKVVEDRLQADFIGTVESDTIIYTILDLEQHIGREISWVCGPTFDALNKKKKATPNMLRRFCTTELKIEPIFKWWLKTFDAPAIEQIGFRANETARAKRMLDRCNEDGLREHKATFEKLKDGRNKWVSIPYARPSFPLIEHGVFKNEIVEYWKKHNVRFAHYNNCVGCFHRNPLFIRKMFDWYPKKMQWFVDQENNLGYTQGCWQPKNGPYAKMGAYNLQSELTFDDFNECDSGHCGL